MYIGYGLAVLVEANLIGRAVDYLTFYATAAWKLWQRTDGNTYVVAKTDPPMISIVAAPIARMRRAKLINWLQDLFPEVAVALRVKFMRWPILNMLTYCRNLTLHTAHMNVAIGEIMKRRLISQGIPLELIKVIPNWADGELIQPVPHQENPLRKAWGVDSKFVIGYSGNLGRAHEFETILDAAEAVKGRSDIVFLFIGGGAQRQALEQAAIDRGLAAVIFKPYQPRSQLSESLSVADVHLISLNPALEGLIVPSKFYGIAAAGRPSIYIGDRSGEIPSILQSCECECAVNSGDKYALVSEILRLADDPSLTKRQGTLIRQHFIEKFDRNISRAAFKEILCEQC